MALALFLALLMAVGVTGRAWRRIRRSDARSIEAHRSALGVIEHLSPDGAPYEAHPGPHVRILPGRSTAPPAPVEGLLPAVPPQRPGRGRPSFPAPRPRDLGPGDLAPHPVAQAAPAELPAEPARLRTLAHWLRTVAVGAHPGP